MKPLTFLFFAVIVLPLLSACSMGIYPPAPSQVTPSGKLVSEVRNSGEFKGIEFRTAGSLVIKTGDQQSIVIRGSDNVVPLVKTRVLGGVLVIEMEDNVNIQAVNKNSMLNVNITLNDLSSLTISGLGSVDISELETQSLKLVLSGAGTINLHNLSVDHLDVVVDGLGNVTLSGIAADCRVEISGAGHVNAGKLKCQTAEADIPGLGSAILWVTERISGEISGSGSVQYFGLPEKKTRTTGLGSFVPLGAR